MTILITGGSGALATDFCSYYFSTPPPEPVVLLDTIPSDLANATNSRLLTFIQADCADFDSLEVIFKSHSFTRVLHFAGSMDSGTQGFMSNVVSTLNIVKLCEKNGLPKIFYPQSFLTRDCSKEINETSDATNLESEYAILKLTAELYLQMYKGPYTVGIVSSSVSPTLSIGPIPAFARRINNGEGITISDTERDYISPMSCAHAIDLSSRPSFTGSLVVIGSGVSTHTKDLALGVCRILGVEPSLPEVSAPKPGDPKRVRFNPSRALVDLGWKPRSFSTEDISVVVERSLKSMGKIRQHHV